MPAQVSYDSELMEQLIPADPIPADRRFATALDENKRPMIFSIGNDNILYLVMAALSVTTVVLSLTDGCPTISFYILELIINGAMIVEVSVRFVAFGRVRILVDFAVNVLLTFVIAAILEIAVQYHGSRPHSILCGNTGLYFLVRVRQHE